MMAHAKFEPEVRALQGVVANNPYYGEQPENLWSAKKRPKLMVKLIEKCLSQIPETEQIKIGNPGGSPEATRRLVNKAFLEALAEDFRQGGAQAIAKVRKEQPAAYMKICALLVPREMKVEHSGGVKAMSDEEIEQAIEAIKTMLAERAGEAAKVIEGTAKPAALPAPEAQSIGAGLEPKRQRRPIRVLMQADTAVGPRERKPRKREGGEDE